MARAKMAGRLGFLMDRCQVSSRRQFKEKSHCPPAETHRGKKKAGTFVPAFRKDLAATYSRGSYTTTTIGKAAFDGRVRDGNGSDHSFMATKSLKISKEHSGSGFQKYSLKTAYRFGGNPTIRELKSHFPAGEKKRSSRTTD